MVSGREGDWHIEAVCQFALQGHLVVGELGQSLCFLRVLQRSERSFH